MKKYEAFVLDGAGDPIALAPNNSELFVQGVRRSRLGRAVRQAAPDLARFGHTVGRHRRIIGAGGAILVTTLACTNPDGSTVPLSQMGAYAAQHPNELISSMIGWGAGLQATSALIGNTAALFTSPEYQHQVGITGALVRSAEEAFDGAVTGGAGGTLLAVFPGGVPPEAVRFWGNLLVPAMVINFARETILGPIRQFQAFRRPAHEEATAE